MNIKKVAWANAWAGAQGWCELWHVQAIACAQTLMRATILGTLCRCCFLAIKNLKLK